MNDYARINDPFGKLRGAQVAALDFERRPSLAGKLSHPVDPTPAKTNSSTGLRSLASINAIISDASAISFSVVVRTAAAMINKSYF